MPEFTIPVIAGDGIGREIMDQGKKVLEAAGRRFGFGLDWLEMPYGADHYLKTGELLPDHAVEEMARHRAVYMGSVGDPRVEPSLLEMGIILKIRFHFDQYVNLRPVVLFEGIKGPLRRGPGPGLDMAVIRENTEDFYMGLGARAGGGLSTHRLSLERSLFRVDFNLAVDLEGEELAFNLGLISRRGAERVIRYGFELARKTGRTRLSLIDKANVIPQMYGLWREAAGEVAAGYPEIELEHVFADAATMWLVKNPERFQVVVAPNLFGDIISDLTSIICGGLGLSPGGNINPEGVSMFEPIGGSAPKYTGKNIINPLAAICSGGMMLETLGEDAAAKAIDQAVNDAMASGKIKSLSAGKMGMSTTEVGDFVASLIK